MDSVPLVKTEDSLIEDAELSECHEEEDFMLTKTEGTLKFHSRMASAEKSGQKLEFEQKIADIKTKLCNIKNTIN